MSNEIKIGGVKYVKPDARPVQADKRPIKFQNFAITIHADGCAGCGACADVCPKDAIKPVGRGLDKNGKDIFTTSYDENACIKCGKCAQACMHDVIVATPHIERVNEALRDEKKFKIIQFAPAVRAAFAQIEGIEPIKDESGKIIVAKPDVAIRKLYKAARLMGFDIVWDTSAAADLVTKLETDEFIDRFTKGTGPIPMFTSCCPVWLNNVKIHHPKYRDNVSTCKSPQADESTFSKTLYAEAQGIDPRTINMTAVMPCIGKKDEMEQDYLDAASVYNKKYHGIDMSGHDTDNVLGTREFAEMIEKNLGMKFQDIPLDKADDWLGEFSQSGVNFGMAGGVARAVIEEASIRLTGKSLDQKSVKFKPYEDKETGYKNEHILIADVKFTCDLTLTIAYTDGVENNDELIKLIDEGKVKPHICEFMSCVCGCANGPAQFANEKILAGIAKQKEAQIAAQKAQAEKQAKQPKPTQEQMAKERTAILGQGPEKRPFGTEQNEGVKKIIAMAGGTHGEKAHLLFHVRGEYPNESARLVRRADGDAGQFTSVADMARQAYERDKRRRDAQS